MLMPDGPGTNLFRFGFGAWRDHLVVVGAYGFVFEVRCGQTWASFPPLDGPELIIPLGCTIQHPFKQGWSRQLRCRRAGFVALVYGRCGQSRKNHRNALWRQLFYGQLLEHDEIVLAGLRGNYLCYPMIMVKHWKILKILLVSSIMAFFYSFYGKVNHGESSGNLAWFERKSTRSHLPVSAFHL